MSALPPRGHVHLIAVCGVGMASLAGLLKSQGYRVTGSDQNVYPPMSTFLTELGIEVLPGYKEERLGDRPDLVVIGNAVSRDNPEVQATLRLAVAHLSFPQALGEFLIGSKRSLVVAGTHGKTTTSSLMAWVLAKAGRQPSFFIGGMPANFGGGLSNGNGDWVVLEGDEYDSAFFDKGPKFLHYRPEKVILTSVEFDHADIYRDLAHLKEAFRRLVELVPASGTLLACNDYAAAKEAASHARCRVSFYGCGEPRGWEARNVRAEGGASWFEPFDFAQDRPYYEGRAESAVKIALMGKHNVSNALAVYATARELGIDHRSIGDAMATFQGVKRRQEFKGEIRGITVLDDFAHHPTAVRETIEAVKAAYPARRIWAVFEPRSNTSRRRIFAREFPQALACADRVVIAGLYQPDKIPIEERLQPEEVAQEINRLSDDGRAVFVEKADEIAQYVSASAKTGDMILVMSNGGFDGVQEKILKLLERKTT